MAFADWKKRSKLYKETINRHTFAWPDIEDACAAAYKAGQRDGMKVADRHEVLAGAYATATARAKHIAAENSEVEKWKRENL